MAISATEPPIAQCHVVKLRDSKASVPLFCFPGSGGNIYIFERWSQLFPKTWRRLVLICNGSATSAESSPSNGSQRFTHRSFDGFKRAVLTTSVAIPSGDL